MHFSCWHLNVSSGIIMKRIAQLLVKTLNEVDNVLDITDAMYKSPLMVNL